jgi:histidinol-phosphate aminotransferase
MSDHDLTRRRFTRAVGTALAASIVAPLPAARAARAPDSGKSPALAPAPPGRPVRLDSNESPYGPLPAALAAMTRSQFVAARYPDDLETPLAEALGRLHGVDPGRVVLGCGSGEVLRMADMAFSGPGRRVVVADPTFEAVLHYCGVTRAEPVRVPLTPGFRHDLPAMAAACDARTGLVYVCNPNNPTGTVVVGDDLARFLARVPRTAVVLVDEAYHHFAGDTVYRSAFDLLPTAPNLLVVRTFSKVYGLAGMRLGYGVGSPEIAAALRRHRIWSNANAAVLEAALASLAERAAIATVRDRLNDTRRELCDHLREDGRRFIPSEANFVMIDVGEDVEPLISAFRGRGVLVGRRFPSLPHHLRVTIGTPEETALFLETLRALVPARAAAPA